MEHECKHCKEIPARCDCYCGTCGKLAEKDCQCDDDEPDDFDFDSDDDSLIGG